MVLQRVFQSVRPRITTNARITPHHTTVVARWNSSYTEYKPITPRPRAENKNTDSGDSYSSRKEGYGDREDRPRRYEDREDRPRNYDRPRQSNYEDRPRQSNYEDRDSRPSPRQYDQDRRTRSYPPQPRSHTNRPQAPERSFADRYSKPGSYEKSKPNRGKTYAAQKKEPEKKKDPYEDLKERHDLILLLIHNTKELFKYLPIEFQLAAITYLQAVQTIRLFEDLYRSTMSVLAPEYKILPTPLLGESSLSPDEQEEQEEREEREDREDRGKQGEQEEREEQGEQEKQGEQQENPTISNPKLEGEAEKIRDLCEGKKFAWKNELKEAVDSIKNEHKDFVTLLRKYEKKLNREMRKLREEAEENTGKEGGN